MAITYTAIQTITVGAGGQSSLDFTSIPATYTDLAVWLCAKANNANFGKDIYLRFNGSSSTIYSYRSFYGYNNGSGNLKGTDQQQNQSYIYSGYVAGSAATAGTNTFGVSEFYIPDYTASTAHPVLIQSNPGTLTSTAYELDQVAGLARINAAINQVSIFVTSNAFVQHTTATLYGILRA